MDTRRGFIAYVLSSIGLFLSSLLIGCGKKPDAETEPSPEWPPKDE